MDQYPDIFSSECQETLNTLIVKYNNMETFYYKLYIESFVDKSLRFQTLHFFKLYNNFKNIGVLLNKVKKCIPIRREPDPEGIWCKKSDPCILLGSEELKNLNSLQDVANYLNLYNLYPLIDSNN